MTEQNTNLQERLIKILVELYKESSENNLEKKLPGVSIKDLIKKMNGDAKYSKEMHDSLVYLREKGDIMGYQILKKINNEGGVCPWIDGEIPNQIDKVYVFPNPKYLRNGIKTG